MFTQIYDAIWCHWAAMSFNKFVLVTLMQLTIICLLLYMWSAFRSNIVKHNAFIQINMKSDCEFVFHILIETEWRIHTSVLKPSLVPIMACRLDGITWTNVGILLFGPLGTNFCKILFELHFHSKKWIWKSLLQNGHFVSASICLKLCADSNGTQGKQQQIRREPFTYFFGSRIP